MVIAIFVGGIGSEIAFRMYLSTRLDLPTDARYQAVNAPTSVFSENHGYNYVPSSTFTQATIEKGKVAMCNRIVSNSEGNLGRQRQPSRATDATILVVGDSFSDNAHLAGLTWPDLMGDELSRYTGSSISVLNYSRSGYGVAQMISMAAEQVDREHPQLLVIPFIINDLARPRFWRTSRQKNGETRLFQSATPTLRPKMADSFDVSLVDAGITDSWCASALEHPMPDDPVLTRLNDHFEQLVIASHRKTRLRTLSESMLYRRLVQRDFTLKQARMVSLPGYEHSSYAEDPVFMADLKRLKTSGVTIQLIRLPRYEELEQGAYLKGTPQEEMLLKSLEQLTASPVQSLLPPLEPQTDIPGLFLLPQDSHPSASGAAFYAREVSHRITLNPLTQHAGSRPVANEVKPQLSLDQSTDHRSQPHT